MAEPLKVVILTTRLPEDIWLINRLAEVCQIEGIIFPTGTRYREYGPAHVLKTRIRRLGLLKVIDQTLLVLYRFIFESRKDKKAERELFDQPGRYFEKKGIDILEVKHVNSTEVQNFIKAKAPRLVVVSAAPLLKKNIIEAAEGRIINLHPGFATQYRGRYGAFWPIYYREPELVGVTIHFVDEGVDTGAILLQQKVDFKPDDTLKIIAYRQHKLGVELLVRVLRDFDGFAAKAYHKTGCPDRNFIAPGLTHYLKGRRWFKRWHREGNVLTSSQEKGTDTISDASE
jgi:folate-dependent phosphoribosylglycinamide formyltransferase PurN